VDVSVIVVTWNARDHVAECLEAVADGPGEIIVVDNASTDGTPDLVAERFPNVRILRLPENRGFGAGNNEGMRAAAGRYFLLLNSDARPVVR
jgi:GT2 family glycosyltransferase